MAAPRAVTPVMTPSDASAPSSVTSHGPPGMAQHVHAPYAIQQPTWCTRANAGSPCRTAVARVSTPHAPAVAAAHHGDRPTTSPQPAAASDTPAAVTGPDTG